MAISGVFWPFKYCIGFMIVYDFDPFSWGHGHHQSGDRSAELLHINLEQWQVGEKPWHIGRRFEFGSYNSHEPWQRYLHSAWRHILLHVAMKVRKWWSTVVWSKAQTGEKPLVFRGSKSSRCAVTDTVFRGLPVVMHKEQKARNGSAFVRPKSTQPFPSWLKGDSAACYA